MYDYLQSKYVTAAQNSMELKVQITDQFFESYPDVSAQDIYRWIWEGEFGITAANDDMTLDRLSTDLRKARTMQISRYQPLWEAMGLSMRIVKINLVPYTDSGCPLNRLLELARKSREMRPNTLRFKRDWYFVKTQIVPGMSVTVEEMNQFENTIPFHMTPDLPFTDHFTETYGAGYRLAPRELFFKYFPEYEPTDYEYKAAFDPVDEE